MRKVALFDLDGTLINEQSQKLFLKFVYRKGIIDFIFYIKIYVWFFLYKIHLVNNPKIVLEKVVPFLQDKSVLFIDEIVNEFFNTILVNHFNNHVTKILADHKRDGFEIILASNSFSFLVEKVARFLEVKYFLGTELEVKNGVFTGKIINTMYGEDKVFHITSLVQRESLDLSDSFAYTDHYSDVSMLELCSNPILVNPDKILRRIGKKRGWKIIEI